MTYATLPSSRGLATPGFIAQPATSLSNEEGHCELPATPRQPPAVDEGVKVARTNIVYSFVLSPLDVLYETLFSPLIGPIWLLNGQVWMPTMTMPISSSRRSRRI